MEKWKELQRYLGIRIQRTLFWLKANGEKKESLKLLIFPAGTEIEGKGKPKLVILQVN